MLRNQLPPSGNQSALKLQSHLIKKMPPGRPVPPQATHLSSVGLTLIHSATSVWDVPQNSRTGASMCPVSRLQYWSGEKAAKGKQGPELPPLKPSAGSLLHCTGVTATSLQGKCATGSLWWLQKEFSLKLRGDLNEYLMNTSAACDTVLAIRQLLGLVWRKSSIWNSWKYTMWKTGLAIKYNKA